MGFLPGQYGGGWAKAQLIGPNNQQKACSGDGMTLDASKKTGPVNSGLIDDQQLNQKPSWYN